MENRAVHRDGGTDLVLGHQLGHECGGRRDLEGRGDSEANPRACDMPDGDGLRGDQCADGNGERGLDQHHDPEDEAFVVPVGNNSAEHGQGEHRNAGDEVDEAEGGCVGGEPRQNPALRHLLHPCAQHRDRFPGHIPGERPGAEQSETLLGRRRHETAAILGETAPSATVEAARFQRDGPPRADGGCRELRGLDLV